MTRIPSKKSKTKVASIDSVAPEIDFDFSEDMPLVPSVAAAKGATLSIDVPMSMSGERLDAALAQLLPDQSRTRLATLVKDGMVLVNGVVAKPKTKLIGLETLAITLVPRPEQTAYLPEARELPILFEDKHLLVINKPAGLVVHPGSGNWSGTLLNALLAHVPNANQLPRAGIVHRLDKDTTGVMVVAKTEAACKNLVDQLAARTVKRTYQAVIRGHIEFEQTINAPIGRHPTQRIKMAVLSATNVNGREAITDVVPIEDFAYHSLVECRLKTGRTHQIRVHMAHIGHPIEGDPVYARKLKSSDAKLEQALAPFLEGERQALHAARLKFLHPHTNKLVSFEAPLPDDMENLLMALGEHADAHIKAHPEDYADKATDDYDD